MLKSDQRCINVKSAVEVITTTAGHSYCLPGSVLDERMLFGHSGLADAYTKMISGCFIHQRYFLADTNVAAPEMICKTGALSSEFTSLFFRLLSKMILNLLAQWKTWFSAQCAAINWEKFCSDGIMEINMLSLSSPYGPQMAPLGQKSNIACGAEGRADDRENTKLDASRYLDSAFNAFHRLCNTQLHNMVCELSAETAANDQELAMMRAMLKRSVSFDNARVICLAFRDLYQFDLLKKKFRLAKMVLSSDDPCHLVEYERHIHLLFIARLAAYTRLLVMYHGDTRVRDWSYISEFFSGVHSRAIERYDSAIFVSSVLRGLAISPVIVDEWNRDLLTLHISLLHRQVRVLFVHDLVMRYFVRRYFTKTCNPKFTVHPFERRDELDYERIRFFVWLVNRSLVNDACYEWQNAIDDAEFWRQVLAHCAALSPSTFVAQLFKYVASLDARVPVNVHDLLDYVEWLCGYDPWYMCYSNSIIERFRLFSENKLQKQFSAFYESECILFYILVSNRLSSVDEKIKFLRERAELRSFEYGDAIGHLSTPDDLFNYSGSMHNTTSLPSTTVPIFNWFNLSSNIFNYGVYYETLDWCAKTVQEYFAFARDEMVRSRQSSTSSLSTIGETHRPSFCRKRPFSAFDIPRDSLSEMIARAAGNKRSRGSDGNQMTTGVDIDSNNVGDCHGGKNQHAMAAPNLLSATNSSTSDNETAPLPMLERYPTNKRFIISLLQNCMNFLNDICLMYNGNLIHKCCAESKHNYNQSNFKDRLKQSNEIWKNDERLVSYRISWKDLDLHKLEESCYREKSEERVSKAIGNTLAACSTSQINVSYLRFRNDGKHSYVIFNAMLRRYEIAAPSLMYLLSLDYKNWHLSDNDCYPSTVDTRVRDYVSIALNEMDGFVDAVVRIDALSMMLHSDMIREKHIGANSAAVLLDKPAASRYVSNANEKLPSVASDNVASSGIAFDDEEEITADSQEKVPFWHNSTRIDDAGEDKSYVDFIIDRTEFFELSPTVPPQWIYRYFEQALRPDRDSVFVYIVLLIVQIVHSYGIWVLARESFTSMITEELLLCVLPRDYLKELRTQKKVPMADEPRYEGSAGHSVKPPINAVPQGGDSGAGNVKRCDLSRFLENQFQQCLAANEHIMKRYRASYRRDADTQITSSSTTVLSGVGSDCGQSVANEKDKVTWKGYFHRNDDNLPGSHLSAPIDTKTQTGSTVHDLFIEQDMRHFFSTNLHSTAFYHWLMSRHCAVRLADVVDLGDSAFIRLFAVFVYIFRVISRQQSRSPCNEKTLIGHDDMSEPADSLARHIMHNAKRVLHELRLAFPCRFVASRSTINLSDAFVDYLERRIMTVHDYRAKKMADLVAEGTAANLGDTVVNEAQDDEDNDPFSHLLCALNTDTEEAVLPLVAAEQHSDDGRIRHVPYLRESLLPYKTRQSISYFLFFIYIFCNCDLSVTLYMLRFLASFLYPGPWAKTVAIVQGSSNSGKSNMFNLVRSFYNSDMAVLNPRALTGPKDNIGTEFLLMCENFVCQTEELKEVEAETIKTMTSDTPLQARSFHSQRQQTVGILASMVITLNQMFRIVSDEGVLERLRVIFRVTHRHLELVRKESDMTRVNCGASMNISHQFMRSVFPRGIVPELFQRGMFHTIMNWCSSQVTSPEERFIHADRVASRYLHTLLHADMPSLSSVHEFSAQNHLNDVEMSRELRHRWHRACVIQESWTSPDSVSLSMQKIMQQMDRRFKRSLSSNVLNEILESIPESTSRSMLERYVFNVDSFNDLLHITPSRLEMRLSHARQYTNCVRLHEQYSGLFSKLRNHCDLIRYLAHTLADSYRPDRQFSASVEQIALPSVNDDEYDDNHVNLMVKPYILDLYLADLHSNIDSFVRFQHTHKVMSHESPIRKEVLQYQLKVFVDRFNATIPDAKYRVKFNEFFDRFETEYEKFKYRDTRTNQIVPNLWAIRVRELVSN